MVPPAQWDSVLAGLGALDTYTSAAYHAVSALLEPPGSRPVLLHFLSPDGDVALPLLLRPLPDGDGWDAISAYGYGGPVARTDRGIAAFGRALDRWGQENGVVSTFLRLHPLFGNAGLVPPTADVVDVGATVAWDVTPGRDLVSHMHQHHRRAARRADRAGLEVSVLAAPTSLDEFRRLYEVTMRRLEAESFFYFPDEYWDELLTHSATLEPVLVEGRLDGRLVAALLCFAKGPWLHYHLGGSDDLARNIGASNRCFLAAAQWAQSRQMSTFHLGGGLGGSADSSLFVFKHRYDLASRPLPFHIAKLVHDPDRYRTLAGTASTSGFFPPWRRSA
ncbi:GNAT family N-acetyltransferase [Blastococcus sp. SYSU DS0973]